MPVMTVLLRGIHPKRGWNGSPRNLFEDPFIQIGPQGVDYEQTVVSGNAELQDALMQMGLQSVDYMATVIDGGSLDGAAIEMGLQSVVYLAAVIDAGSLAPDETGLGLGIQSVEYFDAIPLSPTFNDDSRMEMGLHSVDYSIP